MYDITNKWSFEGINRWIKEVDEHAPGIPKVLVGNRLHLAFKRQVAAKQAENYASRHKMSCFEISPLCDFNIRESFCELARMALHRNGMERIWRTNKGEQFDINMWYSWLQVYHFQFSFIAPRALLSNNSQENEKCLLNRHASTSTVSEVSPQVLRAHNHTQQLSEQQQLSK